MEVALFARRMVGECGTLIGIFIYVYEIRLRLLLMMRNAVSAAKFPKCFVLSATIAMNEWQRAYFIHAFCRCLLYRRTSTWLA